MGAAGWGRGIASAHSNKAALEHGGDSRFPAAASPIRGRGGCTIRSNCKSRHFLAILYQTEPRIPFERTNVCSCHTSPAL